MTGDTECQPKKKKKKSVTVFSFVSVLFTMSFCGWNKGDLITLKMLLIDFGLLLKHVSE